MKIAKLVIGIVTLVLSFVVLFQSCAAGVFNALEGGGSLSGTAGLILALCFIGGGIVGIAARKSRGGAIAAAVVYALGGAVGITNTKNFSDLIIWSVLSFAIAAFFLLSAILYRKAGAQAAAEDNISVPPPAPEADGGETAVREEPPAPEADPGAIEETAEPTEAPAAEAVSTSDHEDETRAAEAVSTSDHEDETRAADAVSTSDHEDETAEPDGADTAALPEAPAGEREE